MMPLGLPVDRRTDAGCLHKISLAPPGVAATDIMDIVNEDLTNSMIKGIEVNDSGERALIFPDILCYTGDCPALASATGTKGHSADCPCHSCSFQKRKGKSLTIIGMDVNTAVCYAKRTHTKIRDIERQAGTDVETLSNIGISNTNGPLMKLSDDIKSLPNIPKTSDGKQVVPNNFDAYRFSLISPDHVFLGLISNSLQLFMRQMKRASREKFDDRITAILRKNGMYGRDTILNSDMNSIMKTTISEAFAILFKAPIAISCCDFVLEEKSDEAFKSSILLIQQLNDIIVRIQRHPKKGVDSERDLSSFNNSEGRTRLNRLVSDVRKHCETIEQLSKIDPSNVAILDKPNMHRFVELFVHTLPMFGSLRYIEELILEKAHQSAKKAIDMSNNKNEQLQAMADYLYDDFTCRLKSLTKDVGNREDTHLAEELKQLTGRKESLDVESVTDRNVLSVIRILGKDICNRDTTEKWCVEERSDFKFPHQCEKVVDQARSFLASVFNKMGERENWKGWCCNSASSATLLKPVGELHETRRLAKVNRFDVLELHCRSGGESRPFVFRRTELDGERRFLVVIGFLTTDQDGRKVDYAVGYFMKELIDDANDMLGRNVEQNGKNANTDAVKRNANNPSLKLTEKPNGKETTGQAQKDNLYTVSTECVVLLELSRIIRKVFVCHACWMKDDWSRNDDRSPFFERMTPVCGKSCSFLTRPCSIIEGGNWVLKGRYEGFPPRRG